ncbi:MAG: pilus assembly protein PilM [Lachnospiraceae bacterium]|nr:pilus assembly protein PilM [Lachnospiraceae bacterium]
MAGKVISIEIGYSLTRICETDYKSKTHKVYKSFTVPTPDGVLNDGALMITQEYVDALKKALTENKVKTRQVMFTITSAKIASREVVIPFVKENRIGDVVNANASDYFPVDLSQYQLAYSILGVIGETKGTQQYKLLVMAAPTALLSGYYDLAKALKLELAAIDYAGNSIYQVVREECAQGNNLIVKIDERSTLVMVVQNGVLSFTRNVSYGVDEALDAVMESRQWGDIQSFSQALQVLESNDCVVLPQRATAQESETSETVIQAAEVSGTTTEENAATAGAEPEVTSETRAKQAVTEALQPLIGGIARVIDYYVSHNGNATIDRVLITGLGANVRGLADLLSREINHPIEILRQAAGWTLEKSFKKEYYGEYTACVGAAAAPLGFKKEADKGKGKTQGAGAGKSGMAVNGKAIALTILIAGTVIAIVLALVATFRYVGIVKKNMELRARATELEEIIPIYNEYVSTLTEYNMARAMYGVTENRNEELVEFLEELEDKLPEDVKVISFTSTIDGIAINMKVSTKSEAAVAIEQLRTFESLIPTSVMVNSVVEDIDEETGAGTVTFSVAAIYRDMAEDSVEE